MTRVQVLAGEHLFFRTINYGELGSKACTIFLFVKLLAYSDKGFYMCQKIHSCKDKSNGLVLPNVFIVT